MKENYTHISIVLDRSGSMSTVAPDTIGGFNSFLEAQQKVPGEATVTLVQFDDVYEELYTFRPVSEAPKLDSTSYVPRGYTALYDAVGRTIDSTGAKLSALPERERPSKVIFVILTDGQENASKEFTLETINKMIGTQREKYSWEFVFIGANIDAVATAKSMAIPVANALNYSNTSIGTEAVFSSVSANAASLRCGKSVDMSWSLEQRKQQDDLLKSPKL